jgi:ketosteroid isomerase-like protein
MASALAAVSRGDIELWVKRYAPDAVHEWSPGLVSLGFPQRATGHAELFDAMSEWDAAWERWTMTQFFIIDLGDRLVALNKIAGRTRDAGVDVDIAHAAINEVPDGLIVRERDFNDWAAGLRAAGIDPTILDRLEALPPGGTLVA